MDEANQSTPYLNDKSYNVLKWMSQILLPAIGALYFSLSEIWGLPKGAEVVGTVTCLDLFLGAMLRVSSHQYDKSGARFDGTLVVEDRAEKKTYSLELDKDPEELDKKDEAVFKVETETPKPAKKAVKATKRVAK